jgi:DNA processing protein
LGFSIVRGIGPARFKLLIDYFGSAISAWSAPEAKLREIGLGAKLTAELGKFRAGFSAETTIAKFHHEGIQVITRIEPQFPRELLEIPDPPIVLYIKGRLPVDWNRAIAVVGTRAPTPYGTQMTITLSRQLAQSGCLIVSGLAKGVDGLAHTAAVELEKPTVAVLGCGVDIIYPPQHKDLYETIIKTGGAIVSEVPPAHTVLRGLFPARNRIISGLSKGIVVTEGAEDSGSLITASYAAEQGKDVFAVPGPATSHFSKGPLKLLKQGAKMVTEASDILDEYGWGVVRKENKKLDLTNFSKQEQQVLAILSQGQLHCDEIVRESHLAAGEIMGILTGLELSGILANFGNGIYGIRI